MEAIGNKIKTHRERVNMTQEELAGKIDTTPQNVYKYEKNIVQNIPLDKIEAMAEVFGISPVQLVGWDADTSGSGAESGDAALSLSDGEKKLISACRAKPEFSRAVQQLLEISDNTAAMKEFVDLCFDAHPSPYARVASPLKPINYGPKKENK